jgi:GT2 family glycosyltransferase
MQVSILIVSKNRKEELERTLFILEKLIDFSSHEVLIFLDGCTDDSEQLSNQFSWVNWEFTAKSIGASPARNVLYSKANGEFLIGLDDDAHPLNVDFISQIKNLFDNNSNLGILAFEEIRGVFTSDKQALKQSEKLKKEFLCAEFIGCGFAIRKSVYDMTNGFPVWIDIYGEESCLSIEVLAKGYDILYTNAIKINHRVNIAQRKENKQNYFRFGKQLKNTTYYFLVYYPFPVFNILKLYWHNFKKYALTDLEYFKIYFKTVLNVLLNISIVLKYRNPVAKSLIIKMRNLSLLKF